MKTLHDALKNSIIDKPVYVTVHAIEYLENLGKWSYNAVSPQIIVNPLPRYMIEVNGELVVNTTEWKWTTR